MTDNFILIAKAIDTRSARKAIVRESALWSEITARQSTKGSPHADTETIFLRWAQAQSIEAVFTELKTVDYPARSKLPEFNSLVSEFEKLVEPLLLGRVIVAKLKPGGVITEHADEGLYADHYERFHIPLIADTGNSFFVRNPNSSLDCVSMKPGDLWWFNHKRPHTVRNDSHSPRIHLIIDAVAPKYRRERDAISA